MSVVNRPVALLAGLVLLAMELMSVCLLTVVCSGHQHWHACELTGIPEYTRTWIASVPNAGCIQMPRLLQDDPRQ